MEEEKAAAALLLLVHQDRRRRVGVTEVGPLPARGRKGRRFVGARPCSTRYGGGAGVGALKSEFSIVVVLTFVNWICVSERRLTAFFRRVWCGHVVVFGLALELSEGWIVHPAWLSALRVGREMLMRVGIVGFV